MFVGLYPRRCGALTSAFCVSGLDSGWGEWYIPPALPEGSLHFYN